jgi:hypothetical protein
MEIKLILHKNNSVNLQNTKWEANLIRFLKDTDME